MEHNDSLDFNSIIPEDSKLISLNEFGGENNVLKFDLDGDKTDEIIYAYRYSNGTCIGILKEIDNEYRIMDLYRGRGVKISYIKVVKKGKVGNIVVGWTIDGTLSLLTILVVEDGIIQNQLKDSQVCFNKIDVVPNKNNTDYYIVLWNDSINHSYKVTIYEFEDGELKKTNKHNKSYYENVVKYYNIMINRYGRTSFYLYNLAKAQLVTEDYSSALETINEALKIKEQEDIPKKRDIEKLRDAIKSKN